MNNKNKNNIIWTQGMKDAIVFYKRNINKYKDLEKKNSKKIKHANGNRMR